MNEMDRINEWAVKSVLQHAVLRELRELHACQRDALAERLSKGMRIPADVDGETIGSVTMTNPKPVAQVVDVYEVMAWAVDNMPEVLTPRIANMDAAIEFLAEHAPHLVTTDIPDYHRKTICRRAEAGEDIPGVQVHKSQPVMQIRSQDAKALAERVIERALDKEIEAASRKEIEQ